MKKTYLTVIIALMLLLSQTAEAGTANINLDTTRQTMRGYGGMNFPRWIDDLTAAQADKAFGNGDGQIGFSILRVEVPPYEDDWADVVPTAQRAANHGAIIMASPWSPPPSMKTNNNVVGGQLSTSSYSAFANYLRDFANYMSSNGASLYAISVQNEPDYLPDYDSCGWTASQMQTFLNNNASVIPTRVLAPETTGFNSSYMNTVASSSQCDIVGIHIYGGSGTYSGKEYWMTEHLVNDTTWSGALATGREIHNCMTQNMSAYIWWYIRRSYGPIDESGNITKRGYVMSHFAKFVRPGYVRVDATASPQSNVYVTAYKSGSTVVIVAINQNSSSQSVTFSVSGGTVSSYTKYETTSSSNMANRGSVGSTNTLAASSMNTFVGTIGTADTTPPTPDPMTWSSFPEATGQTTIAMTATTATDADSPPVQYYFECTNDGSKSSSWQSSASYTASGLTPNTQYSFRVQARDSAATPNVNGWSSTQYATTDPPVQDTTPPTPDPMTWSSFPTATGSSTITMTATTATDATSPPVQYYFECTNDGSKSSGWQSSSTYVASGLTASTQYSFRARARDSAATPNVTGWSSTMSATTDPAGEGIELLGSWVNGTSHTKESGSNRALIVIAHAEGSSWRNPTLSTVTYGGQTMTKITDRVQSYSWQTRAYVGAFILNEAGVNAATSSTISASWGGSPTSTSITSVFLGGVDQADLVGAYATNGVSNTGTITTSALATSSGDMVIEGGTCTETGTYTANNGFTKGVDLGVSSFDGMGGHKPATGASETPSVTHSTSTNRQALLGFVVQAGGSGGGSAPGQASNPSPSNGATSVGVTTDLSWTAGSGATSHDVYFGTSSPGTFRGNQTGTTYDTGTMTASTTYYWRIDEKNDYGTTTGTVWSFTTAAGGGSPVSLLGSWGTGTSHTKESGSNRALIFIAHAESTSTMNLSAVTYGGQSMTKVLEYNYNAASGYAYAAIFILKETDVAAASSSTFTPTWSGTAPGSAGYSSAFFSNVNQTTSTGATGTGGSTSNPVTTSSLATSSGDMVILGATCGNSGSYTLNNGFTEGNDQTMGGTVTGVTGHKSATGANETPSATYSSSINRQMIIGLVVKHQ
ncbi:MAG: hypothetical protein PHQ35_06025 [Phycisphaerae bacterium]|nr:hypothetical protein [Phycisphaerae bacterium]MDD5381264.1 hypothetical protein [Phycisphaerae bacterium]